MTIGAHDLKGKIQSLKQPFVIMKPRTGTGTRKCNTADTSLPSNSSKRMKLNHDMEVDEKDGYEVAGIVTSKILFDRYPKSIMR